MHLRYYYPEALEFRVKEHAEIVMKEMGITYQYSTPQSMGEQWWFWNCQNVPEPLPSYITPLDLDPMDCIGYGLSPEEAGKIKERQKELEDDNTEQK